MFVPFQQPLSDKVVISLSAHPYPGLAAGPVLCAHTYASNWQLPYWYCIKDFITNPRTCCMARTGIVPELWPIHTHVVWHGQGWYLNSDQSTHMLCGADRDRTWTLTNPHTSCVGRPGTVPELWPIHTHVVWLARDRTWTLICSPAFNQLN